MKKVSVILVGKSLDEFNYNPCFTSTISIFHNIYSNALPFEEILLGGKGIL